MTRVGFIDSGLGLVGYADALVRAIEGLELILAMDPEHSPYGALPPEGIVERTLASARAAAEQGAQALVIACNTASVHALDAVRAWTPMPVIGTVPAVRSAARLGGPFAVWATEATTGSPYQTRLIDEFARHLPVTQIACAGLASAIDHADEKGVQAAIAGASARTPKEVRAVVLGCTHYGLVADRIAAALPPGVEVLDSPEPVARQTVRRLAEAGMLTTSEAANALARLSRTALHSSAGSPSTEVPAAVTVPDRAAMTGPPEVSGTPAGITTDHLTTASGGRISAVLRSGSLSELPQELGAFPAGRRLLDLRR